MDEYIKREDAIRTVASVTTRYAEDEAMKSICLNALLSAPTADVVPKSEVEKLESEIERLKHILDCYALQYGTVKEQQDVIDKAKAEVASEILMHIKALMQIIILDYKEIGAFDNAEIVGYVRDHLIVELGKRYTEGEK